MTTFTAPNYLQDGARTVAEMKLAFEQNLGATKELVSGLPVTPITMSGTSITPVAGSSALLSVATPGGAASANLANCIPTNTKNGSWLALRMANAGQLVVVKHGAGGAGQFELAGNADLTLGDPTVVLIVALNGTIWQEVGRFYGTQVLAARTFYQVAGLGQNRFTGRQELAFGAPLTAAATIALGADGNAFNVIGATTIFGLSAAPVGTVVTLVFAGNPLLVNNNATFYLGGFNMQAAGQVLQFLSTGAGAWRLLGGGQASATVDRTGGSIVTGGSGPIYNYTIPAYMLTGGRRLRFLAEVLLKDDTPGGIGAPASNYHFGIYLNFSGITLARLLIGTSYAGSPDGALRASLFSPGAGGHLVATLADYGGALVAALSWQAVPYFSPYGALGTPVFGDPGHIGFGTLVGDVSTPQTFGLAVGAQNASQSLTLAHGVMTLE